MENIKISVIIPVYNTQKYLKKCLDSVLQQSLQDYEIICINDGSVDCSGEILKEYAANNDRIVLFTQANQGLSVARNVGIKAARGEYIYFLDSDDYIEPDTLETAYHELETKRLDIVYFDMYAFGEDGISQKAVDDKNKYYDRSSSYPAVYTGKELLYALLKNHDYSCPVCKQVIRREFLQKHQILFYNGIIHEDELYTIQTMMLAGRVAYIERVLYHRRLRPGSIMTRPLDFQSVYGYFICVKEAFPFLIQRGCNAVQLRLLMMLLNGLALAARNQYLKLAETEQSEFEKLSEEEKFLFRLCIADYANSIKQRDKVLECNRILLGEKDSLNKRINDVQQKIVSLEKVNAETAKKLNDAQRTIVNLEKVNTETAKKLCDAQQKIVGLEKVNAETAKKLNDAQRTIVNLEKVNTETAKKLCDAQQKIVGLENVNAETAKKLNDTQQKVVDLEKKSAKIAKTLETEETKAAKLTTELRNVKNGWSFRIGRVITWLPRKIKGLL